MEAIHVLGGIDGQGNPLFVDMLGQGQLHDEAVHFRILIELCHHLHEFSPVISAERLSNVLRKPTSSQDFTLLAT